MKYSIEELRKMPTINYLVPYKWMSKLTNEEITEWEIEAIQEAKEKIKNDVRATPAEFNHAKYELEVKAIVNDKANIMERDYILTTIG